MSDRRLSNARIQGWLAADLDRVAEQMDGPKALVNSAAVWWFCHRLTAEERAKILGEFVTAQALRGSAEAAAPATTPAADNSRPPRPGRRRGGRA
jgi:hypothetical protein